MRRDEQRHPPQQGQARGQEHPGPRRAQPPARRGRHLCAQDGDMPLRPWQAALHLRVHASCPDFLHVLAALDEAAALVIVLRACDSLRVTLGVYLCGWPVCIRDVVRVNI